jgi:hypothetical protein
LDANAYRGVNGPPADQTNDSALAETPPAGVSGAAITNGTFASNSIMSNGRLAFGAGICGTAATVGPGFTQRSALRNNVAEDMNITSSGQVVQATFMDTDANDDWVAQLITLK